MQVNHLKTKALEMVFICQIFVNLVLISMIVLLNSKYILGYAMIQALLELKKNCAGDLVLQPDVTPTATLICTRIPMEKHML